MESNRNDKKNLCNKLGLILINGIGEKLKLFKEHKKIEEYIANYFNIKICN